jgi:hypothetical protein
MVAFASLELTSTTVLDRFTGYTATLGSGGQVDDKRLCRAVEQLRHVAAIRTDRRRLVKVI